MAQNRRSPPLAYPTIKIFRSVVNRLLHPLKVIFIFPNYSKTLTNVKKSSNNR